MARGFFSGLLDIIFPPRCTFCRKFLKNSERHICGNCEKSLPYADKEEIKGDFFTLCVAPLYYKGNVRDSILRFKFKNATNYATCYGRMLSECIAKSLSGQYDYITWVPLSKKRLKKRGYDQAMLLAMATALELGEVALELLKKTIDIPAQSGLGAREKRKANVSGAYEVIDPELIRDKRILLIDDIVTTGSTLSECARMLLMAGAESVVCAALAAAERDKINKGVPLAD
ncbi:MAG: ComF family protein [Clostridiales bacterium]|nr:ComF family protein [Clostridiales bacterium]